MLGERAREWVELYLDRGEVKNLLQVAHFQFSELTNNPGKQVEVGRKYGATDTYKFPLLGQGRILRVKSVSQYYWFLVCHGQERFFSIQAQSSEPQNSKFQAPPEHDLSLRIHIVAQPAFRVNDFGLVLSFDIKESGEELVQIGNGIVVAESMESLVPALLAAA